MDMCIGPEAPEALEERKLRIDRIAAPKPWSACLIPMNELPVAKEERTAFIKTMLGVVTILRNNCPHRELTQRSVWLQIDELHKDNAVREIGHNARRWHPKGGLGVYPTSELPRYWTKEDFTDRDYDSPVPVFIHYVEHLNTDEDGATHAVSLMTGTGGLIQTLHRKTADAVCKSWFDTIQPMIQEEGLAAYPLYIPLLTSKDITDLAAEMLDLWMGEVDVYIRESYEDNGILILSRFSLESISGITN
jgi:hypothetical protein